MYYFSKKREENDDFDCSDITFKIDRDVSVDAIMEEFRAFLLAVGFHPQSINDYFGENEYGEEKE